MRNQATEKWERTDNIPLDGKSSDSWLFRQDIPHDSIRLDFGRGFGIEFLIVVFIVDVVSNADEFAAVVGASEKDNGNPKDFGGGEFSEIWGLRLEDEFVDANWNRPDEQRIKFLVVFGAVIWSENHWGGWEKKQIWRWLTSWQNRHR